MLNRTSRSLIVASFIGGFAESLFIPMYAPFVEQIGGSMIDVGVGFAVFNITVGIFIIIFGSLKFFERNVSLMLIFGCLLLGIADFLLLMVHTQMQFLAVQVFFGIGLGVFNPAWDSMYSEDTSISQIKKWSLWTGGATFVIGIASLVSGVIVKYVGFNGLFLTMGAIDMIAVGYAIRAHQRFAIQRAEQLQREKLEAEKEANSNIEFVKVWETRETATTALVNSILNSNGIRCYIQSDTMKFISPSNSADPVVLMVATKDAPQAAKLLNDAGLTDPRVASKLRRELESVTA
jgi:MFS family permease